MDFVRFHHDFQDFEPVSTKQYHVLTLILSKFLFHFGFYPKSTLAKKKRTSLVANRVKRPQYSNLSIDTLSTCRLINRLEKESKSHAHSTIFILVYLLFNRWNLCWIWFCLKITKFRFAKTERTILIYSFIKCSSCFKCKIEVQH